MTHHDQSPALIRLTLPAVALLAGLAGAPAAAQERPEQGLSPLERRIAEAVAARHDEAVALLQRVVDVNSGTLNPAGVLEVGDLFASELEELGFTTRWVPGEAIQRAGHLFAERPASGPRVLLIGHLDTVFEPDSPFQRFERTGPETARGPGIADMNGGDVIMLEALRALAAVGELDRLQVTVALTGDEERPGRPLDLTRRELEEAADAADVAVAFENGDNRADTAVVARRGSTGWRLEVGGRPAHSSLVFSPEVGYGAIFEAARILDAFRRELAGEEYLTFNPGVVLGGTQLSFDGSQSRGEAFGKGNVIAEHAVVAGDLRTLSAEQLATAKHRMQEIVAAHLPHTTAILTFDDSYPPMAPSPGNLRLLALLDRVSQDLGLGPVTAVDPMDAGAADVAFTAGRVDMAIDGLGLLGADEHTTNESADLSTLTTQAQRTAVLLHRLSRGAAGP